MSEHKNASTLEAMPSADTFCVATQTISTHSFYTTFHMGLFSKADFATDYGTLETLDTVPPTPTHKPKPMCLLVSGGSLLALCIVSFVLAFAVHGGSSAASSASCGVPIWGQLQHDGQKSYASDTAMGPATKPVMLWSNAEDNLQWGGTTVADNGDLHVPRISDMGMLSLVVIDGSTGQTSAAFPIDAAYFNEGHLFFGLTSTSSDVVLAYASDGTRLRFVARDCASQAFTAVTLPYAGLHIQAVLRPDDVLVALTARASDAVPALIAVDPYGTVLWAVQDAACLGSDILKLYVDAAGTTWLLQYNTNVSTQFLIPVSAAGVVGEFWDISDYTTSVTFSSSALALFVSYDWWTAYDTATRKQLWRVAAYGNGVTVAVAASSVTSACVLAVDTWLFSLSYATGDMVLNASLPHVVSGEFNLAVDGAGTTFVCGQYNVMGITAKGTVWSLNGSQGGVLPTAHGLLFSYDTHAAMYV